MTYCKESTIARDPRDAAQERLITPAEMAAALRVTPWTKGATVQAHDCDGRGSPSNRKYARKQACAREPKTLSQRAGLMANKSLMAVGRARLLAHSQHIASTVAAAFAQLEDPRDLQTTGDVTDPEHACRATVKAVQAAASAIQGAKALSRETRDVEPDPATVRRLAACNGDYFEKGAATL